MFHLRPAAVALVSLFLGGIVNAASATLPGPAFPTYETAEAVAKACDEGLAGAKQRIDALERTPPGITWLRAWDGLYQWNEDHFGALIFLQNVHPDPKIREASSACELRWQDMQTALGQNEKVYEGGRRTHLKDPIDQRTVQVALEGFEDFGVSLANDKRIRAKQILDELTQVGQQFARNIRDANIKVKFTADELKGVPENVWKDAPRDADGKIELGVDYPISVPVIQYAESAATRERMWRAKTNQGGMANIQLLAKMVARRQELAELFGYKSFDDYTMRRRMVETTARAMGFLDEVSDVVRDSERHNIEELREAKARDLGTSITATRLERWDEPYYTERVRKAKYTIDAESFRQYFPPQESLQFVMRVAEKMFGIHYERVPGTYWAPDVQAYAVSDVATGKPLASLYVDLYPRDGKYHHAAVWSYRNAATSANRVAQAALVVNFDREGLTMDELETLLHEFGHSLHSTLSATRWASNGGTNVMLDFVEAPSQMLEDWVYDPRVLKVFQEVCPSCKPVPDALVLQAKQARDYGKGVKFARQHLYASYDLTLYSGGTQDPLALWQKMEGATPLGYVPGTLFPANFAHIAGDGYAAGYYGYLWSLVVAMDLRTAFAADHLDPIVGARYRQAVIGQGNQKPPRTLVKDFLGRDVSNAAFFDYLKN